MNWLAHHGVLGQKWGVKHGPPYPLKPKTVFVSGSSKTQFKDDPYYRKELPNDIKKELDYHIGRKNKIVVGDAPGIDRQVQDYLRDKNYDNVEIYGPGKKVRYKATDKWKDNPIDASEFEEYSGEWLAKKDKVMSEVADVGLAVILDQGSLATRNNVDRLLRSNKDVKIYQLNPDNSDQWVSKEDYIKRRRSE